MKHLSVVLDFACKVFTEIIHKADRNFVAIESIVQINYSCVDMEDWTTLRVKAYVFFNFRQFFLANCLLKLSF